MGLEQALRSIVWAAAAVGVAIAFAWPFVVSTNPDDPLLRMLSRGTVLVLLLALGASAVARARRHAGRARS